MLNIIFVAAPPSLALLGQIVLLCYVTYCDCNHTFCVLYATTTSRAHPCVHSALLLCSLKQNLTGLCAIAMCIVQSLSSQYPLPSILLSGWIIVDSQQWPSEGNPSQRQLCLCYMRYYTPLVLLYTSCAIIHLLCSHTPQMCYVQKGIYCGGAVSLLCALLHL